MDNHNKQLPFDSITIKGLFQTKNIHLELNSRCRILVGENGLGKTTILRILHYIHKADLRQLVSFDFKELEIKLSESNQILKISKNTILKFDESVKYITEDLDESGYLQIEREILKVCPFVTYKDIQELSKDAVDSIIRSDRIRLSEWDLYMTNPADDIEGLIKNFPDIFILKSAIARAGIEVIYLPTYRRIEADVKKLLRDAEYIEIQGVRTRPRITGTGQGYSRFLDFLSNNLYMRFGMGDIKGICEDLLNKISDSSVKGFSKVSGEMIGYLLSGKEDLPQSEDWTIEDLDIVLQRVGDNLSDFEKNNIRDSVRNGRINENPYLAYFLSSLREVYKTQRIYDETLKSFVKSCNAFLVDKSYYYDESHVKMGIYFKKDVSHENLIGLDKLSSGEKQLVSLMAMAHLRINKNIIFLIDEPELSLSLPWQEKLIPEILSSSSCLQVIAVTHSPFIFNNELRDCAIGSPEYSVDNNLLNR